MSCEICGGTYWTADGEHCLCRWDLHEGIDLEDDPGYEPNTTPFDVCGSCGGRAPADTLTPCVKCGQALCLSCVRIVYGGGDPLTGTEETEVWCEQCVDEEVGVSC